jgi:hypothetical protein
MTVPLSAARWRTGSPGPGCTTSRNCAPGSSGTTEVRILFIFDPARNAVLLVAGDKSGQWDQWYRDAISAAEAAYDAYRKGMGRR